jgi:hypothetical protein
MTPNYTTLDIINAITGNLDTTCMLQRLEQEPASPSKYETRVLRAERKFITTLLLSIEENFRPQKILHSFINNSKSSCYARVLLHFNYVLLQFALQLIIMFADVLQ